MSGGHFDYANDFASAEIFGDDCCANYGMGDKNYLKSVKKAIAKNPLDNETLSELAFDVFCLLHSYDWYICGDTGIEDYDTDVRFFKEKWLKYAADVAPVRWIPVTERLPEARDFYLATTGNAVYYCDYLAGANQWWAIVDCVDDELLTENVTHWMPLPEPPKGETE